MQVRKTETVMALKFFHLPKGRQFNINPRYWDPQKEESENREKRMKTELGIVDEEDRNRPFKPNLKGQFRISAGPSSKSTSDARKTSNIRLLILIVSLSLVAYFLFFT